MDYMNSTHCQMNVSQGQISRMHIQVFFPENYLSTIDCRLQNEMNITKYAIPRDQVPKAYYMSCNEN
jgi:hypothetical protein